MSLAVKRSTDNNGHKFVKRPALEPVNQESSEVCLPTCIYDTCCAVYLFLLIPVIAEDALMCICLVIVQV